MASTFPSEGNNPQYSVASQGEQGAVETLYRNWTCHVCGLGEDDLVTECMVLQHPGDRRVHIRCLLDGGEATDRPSGACRSCWATLRHFPWRRTRITYPGTYWLADTLPSHLPLSPHNNSDVFRVAGVQPASGQAENAHHASPTEANESVQDLLSVQNPTPLQDPAQMQGATTLQEPAVNPSHSQSAVVAEQPSPDIGQSESLSTESKADDNVQFGDQVVESTAAENATDDDTIDDPSFTVSQSVVESSTVNALQPTAVQNSDPSQTEQMLPPGWVQLLQRYNGSNLGGQAGAFQPESSFDLPEQVFESQEHAELDEIRKFFDITSVPEAAESFQSPTPQSHPQIANATESLVDNDTQAPESMPTHSLAASVQEQGLHQGATREHVPEQSLVQSRQGQHEQDSGLGLVHEPAPEPLPSTPARTSLQAQASTQGRNANTTGVLSATGNTLSTGASQQPVSHAVQQAQSDPASAETDDTGNDWYRDSSIMHTGLGQSTDPNLSTPGFGLFEGEVDWFSNSLRVWPGSLSPPSSPSGYRQSIQPQVFPSSPYSMQSGPNALDPYHSSYGEPGVTQSYDTTWMPSSQSTNTTSSVNWAIPEPRHSIPYTEENPKVFPLNLQYDPTLHQSSDNQSEVEESPGSLQAHQLEPPNPHTGAEQRKRSREDENSDDDDDDKTADPDYSPSASAGKRQRITGSSGVGASQALGTSAGVSRAASTVVPPASTPSGHGTHTASRGGGAGAVQRAQNTRSAWSDEEVALAIEIYTEVVEARKSGRMRMTTEAMHEHVAQRLSTQSGIKRTAHSCKNQWNRVMRAQAQLDERKQSGKPLATSLQGEGETKRRRPKKEEGEGDGDDDDDDYEEKPQKRRKKS